MAQEEIQLLLKDLSARLMYGVICQVDDGAAGLNDGKLIEIDISRELVRFDDDGYWDAYIDDVKPYLRSMSSMTEEEKLDYTSIDNRAYCCPQDFAHIPATDRIDWLNVHHFDYRGLIEKGLAIKVTENNNPYK
jgi:hypothetical protein